MSNPPPGTLPMLSPLRLPDDRSVWLRPIDARDAPRLIDLCQRVSPESRRRRFLRATHRCDPNEALRLASVDQQQRIAIAVVPDPGPDAPIVAVGRYHQATAEQAEFALLVDDAFQNMGLGRALLNRLTAEAARRGLRALQGYVMFDNRPMLHLLRTSGRPLTVQWDGEGVLNVSMGIEVHNRTGAAIA